MDPTTRLLRWDPAVRAVLEQQSGVVARRQLLDAGLTDNDVRRLLRGRDLVPVRAGVYLTHTGEPTWTQSAWAAVLTLWPAALWRESALRSTDGPGRLGGEGPLQVAVDRDRSPGAPSGVRVHRVALLDESTLWTASPPRQRVEQAVLDVAAGATTDLRAIAVVADAVQSRRTTPARLREALDGRDRIARRALLDGVIYSVGEGVHSALEHGFLTRVERPHGLPRGRRQAHRAGCYDDVSYDEQGVVVELDGRLFHDHAVAHDRDLQRDLDVAVLGRRTLRLGWGQVYGRPCATALQVARVLQQAGWRGAPTLCPACTPLTLAS